MSDERPAGIPHDLEGAARWMKVVSEQAATLRRARDLIARQEDELDRYLLAGSLYLSITDLAAAAQLSRPTIYKAIERARTKADSTVKLPHADE